MQIQITSTNVQYREDEVSSVSVSFNGRDPERQVNLNGRIPITAEEYNGNSSLPALAKVVKRKLIERLELEEESE
ncbi:hypothetical protein J2S74_002318 [Evansella vedderi]|uniref:Phage protein n=1 Tax=Evansella vedderi TaxID=38282 RepID=A0ABT9ZW19_9BACI|nr:hypothetical protein [Evansella vedderi]MDQ0254936.1 hypothetical protein [Evansella vedderi]